MGVCNSTKDNKNSYIKPIKNEEKNQSNPYNQVINSNNLKSNKTIINSKTSNNNISNNIPINQNNKKIIYPKGKALLFSRVEE